MSARELTITKLRRDHGYWQARVTAGGRTINVDRRYGSWQAEPDNDYADGSGRRTDVLPYVAAALQAKVRPIEKRSA